MEKLFVYGSLGPGRENEGLLKGIGGSWRRGSVCGKLYQEGWGAEMGYPGIRLDERTEIIEGHPFCSNRLAEHWEELDNFEGPAYLRIRTKIRLEEDGKEVEAFVYALR
ncbi:MAG: gamma-glutamylcyclotransferase [Saprospiraceae bacterium]|nr:gamma-glutamylcyclotransferase [Saprospiraceae bacterium]